MNNNTYRSIQKLIVFFAIAVGIMLNINVVSSYVKNIFSLFTPFITGICIAFILNIPMKKIEKVISRFSSKKSRGLSIVLTIIAFILVLSLIFSMIIPEIINSFVEIRNGLPTVIANFEEFMKTSDNQIVKMMANLGMDFDKIYSNVTDFFKNFSLLDATNALQSIFSATTNVFSSVMNVFLGLIFAIYILSQKEILLSQAHSLLRAILPKEQTRTIVSFVNLVSSSFAKFIAGQGTEAVILCMLFLVSMSLLNIPKAVPIATIIGLFSLVPIVGAFIAASYGVLSILIVSPIKSLWFLILFLVLQQIEGNLIYPRVVGRSVGLPGVWVLLAITVGGNFAGITGMIMAVPTMSIVYTLVATFVRDSKKRQEMGSKKGGYNEKAGEKICDEEMIQRSGRFSEILRDVDEENEKMDEEQKMQKNEVIREQGYKKQKKSKKK